jgi:hypothetical protein
MTFKPALWFPIATVLSIINLVAVGFTEGPYQTLHATAHAALALAFGLWAYRLRQRSTGRELEARFDAMEIEVTSLRQELSDAHERLNFAERMLTQGPDAVRATRAEPRGQTP